MPLAEHQELPTRIQTRVISGSKQANHSKVAIRYFMGNELLWFNRLNAYPSVWSNDSDHRTGSFLVTFRGVVKLRKI